MEAIDCDYTNHMTEIVLLRYYYVQVLLRYYYVQNGRLYTDDSNKTELVNQQLSLSFTNTTILHSLTCD